MDFDSVTRTTSTASSHSIKPTQHSEWNMKSIQKLWQNGAMCDVVIVAGTKRMPAHRLILSVGCKYFHDMFTLDVREANQKEITIEGVDGQAMENLIDCMYSGKLTLNETNVENLIVAADMMCMDNVLRVGFPFLAKQLHPSNCLGIKDFAIAHSSRELTAKAHNYIMNHIEEVLTHEEFLQLPLKQVYQLFRDERSPNVSTQEVTLLKAALTWLASGDEARKQHAPDLLSCIKLNVIQQEMLSEVLQANPFLRENEKCKQLFEAASHGPARAVSHRRPRPLPKIPINIIQAARLWWAFYCMHPRRALDELSGKLCAGTRDRGHRERCYKKLLSMIDALATETKRVVKDSWGCTYYQVSRIINLLNRNFKFVSDQLQQLAIKCLAEWTERGLPLGDCKYFLSNVQKCAKKPSFFKIVADFMVKVCQSNNSPCTPFRDNFILEVLSFRPELQEWVAMKDVERIADLTNWACACARATDHGFKQPLSERQFNLFKLITELTALPLQYPIEETNTETCFNLWWEIIPRMPVLVFRDLRFFRFGTLYRNVLWTVLFKGRYPIDGSYRNWPEESRRLHRTYRARSFKLTCMISQLLGPSITFNFLLGQFNETAQGSEQPHSWDLAEPWLFGICAVCFWHDPQNFSQLPDLVDALAAVPMTSKVMAGAIFILASTLSTRSWLQQHPDRAQRLFVKIWKHINKYDIDKGRTAVDALIRVAKKCFSVSRLKVAEYFDAVLTAVLKQLSEPPFEAEIQLLESAVRLLTSLSDAEFLKLRAKFIEMYHRLVLSMMKEKPPLHNCNGILLAICLIGRFEALCLEERRTTRPRQVMSDDALPIPKQLEETLVEISNHWIDCLNPCDLDCCSDAVEKPKPNAVCLLDDLTKNGSWPHDWGGIVLMRPM